MVLPRGLAHELMATGVVAPYMRDERTDPTLIPSVVAAATTAATTVVVTQLTKDTVGRLGGQLRKWLSRPGHEGKIELSIRSDGQRTIKTFTVTAAVPQEDLLSFLQQAVADAEPRADDDD
jgi:hypothetical protein